jgi:thymidylate synthase
VVDTRFFQDGLRKILADGWPVPSVRGQLSTASNFGAGDRPWREVIGHQFSFRNDNPFLFHPAQRPIHIPYCLGLLSWTLEGRDDVESLAYYRPAARRYSDDGHTMCGSFGARLFGRHHDADQIQHIITRLREDPASRRTYATICLPADNLSESREYPCAAGIQLFLRDNVLHMMTTMRAQHALNILPYDVFLFSTLHHFIANALDVPTGQYHHHSATYHVYENEMHDCAEALGADTVTVDLPGLERNSGDAIQRELGELEQGLRQAATAYDGDELTRLSHTRLKSQFAEAARPHLVTFAESVLRTHVGR